MADHPLYLVETTAHDPDGTDHGTVWCHVTTGDLGGRRARQVVEQVAIDKTLWAINRPADSDVLVCVVKVRSL